MSWETKHEDIYIYIYIKERDVQLGNVASRVTIVRTVTFDKGVVVFVIKTCGVDGCSCMVPHLYSIDLMMLRSPIFEILYSMLSLQSYSQLNIIVINLIYTLQNCHCLKEQF